MKTFNLKYKSFWWYVLTFNGEFQVDNVCDIPTNLLRSLFVLIMMGTVITFLITGILSPVIVYYDYFGFKNEWSEPLTVASGAFLYVTGMVFGLFWGIDKGLEKLFFIMNRRRMYDPERDIELQPSIVSVWWKSIKEKTCVKIEVDYTD